MINTINLSNYSFALSKSELSDLIRIIGLKKKKFYLWKKMELVNLVLLRR